MATDMGPANQFCDNVRCLSMSLPLSGAVLHPSTEAVGPENFQLGQKLLTRCCRENGVKEACAVLVVTPLPVLLGEISSWGAVHVYVSVCMRGVWEGRHQSRSTEEQRVAVSSDKGWGWSQKCEEVGQAG